MTMAHTDRLAVSCDSRDSNVWASRSSSSTNAEVGWGRIVCGVHAVLYCLRRAALFSVLILVARELNMRCFTSVHSLLSSALEWGWLSVVVRCYASMVTDGDGNVRICGRHDFEAQKTAENNKSIERQLGKPKGARHQAYYSYMQSLKHAEEAGKMETVRRRGHHDLLVVSHRGVNSAQWCRCLAALGGRCGQLPFFLLWKVLLSVCQP